MRLWTESVWLRTGINEQILWIWQWTFWFSKIRGICWLTQRLSDLESYVSRRVRMRKRLPRGWVMCCTSSFTYRHHTCWVGFIEILNLGVLQTDVDNCWRSSNVYSWLVLFLFEVRAQAEEIFKYSRPPFIRISLDGEPSGYAEYPDNWIFKK